jgi:hypothetical protein
MFRHIKCKDICKPENLYPSHIVDYIDSSFKSRNLEISKAQISKSRSRKILEFGMPL